VTSETLPIAIALKEILSKQILAIYTEVNNEVLADKPRKTNIDF
jgi:hypothetical protein